MAKLKKQNLYWLMLPSAGFYIYIAYFLDRSESIPLLTAYTLLFVFYSITLIGSKKKKIVTNLVIASVVFRLLLLFAFPNLSDDIYRFVWDGRLINAGLHPFAELPNFYLKKSIAGIDQELFSKLNSKQYFTIYPPIAQFIFWLSTAFTDSIFTSVIIIRLLIIAAEIGSIVVIIKLLDIYNLPKKKVLIYALNPLVILELTGNLHFEGFMIFFLLLFVYFLEKSKPIQSGIFFAFSVASKLIPLMMLPVLLKKLPAKKWFSIYIISGLAIALLFLPLFSIELVNGMMDSLSLYFQTFEFNASIYYLVRQIGLIVIGYNIIGIAGPYLAIAAFVIIMIISLRHKKESNIFPTMMWILLTYFLFATTVHPWYITTLVAISLFTEFRFALVWSFIIFFTYLGYSTYGFEENNWVIFFEYAVLFGFIRYEWKLVRQKNAW
jgi:alpha-1,6-mannosyltransferase